MKNSVILQDKNKNIFEISYKVWRYFNLFLKKSMFSLEEVIDVSKKIKSYNRCLGIYVKSNSFETNMQQENSVGIKLFSKERKTLTMEEHQKVMEYIYPLCLKAKKAEMEVKDIYIRNLKFCEEVSGVNKSGILNYL